MDCMIPERCSRQDRGAVRVPVRRVRVHVRVPAVAVAVAVCSVVDVRRRRRLLLLLLLVADGGGAHGGGGAVLEVDAREVACGDGVDDERADGAHHGAEPREGEVLPRPAGEAVGRELLERVGEDVDEPRGQDDPRRERLDEEEHVPVRAQRRHAPPQHGQAAAQRPAHEDGEEGCALTGTCFFLIKAYFFAFRLWPGARRTSGTPAARARASAARGLMAMAARRAGAAWTAPRGTRRGWR
jgi:hypothetical protein